ncbi:winged helix-turn-helix domain-containing protein [Haladaptatus sp. CMAA 1911]|uniref:winged helix-turn-helix domain-containing protein n=1 Tax=unclassified Haladaptatus TaxID=2622732 RepID=UPI003754C7BA
MSKPAVNADAPNDMTMKEQRLEYPSGWLYLCQHESIHLILDALLQVDPKKEFNKTELAEFAGISTQSVRRHIDRLVELGIVAETAGGRRYHYNLESEAGQLVAELNAELAASGVEQTDV